MDWMRLPKLQNVREESPPGVGNQQPIDDGKNFQLIQTYKCHLPFVSLHSILAQTFPIDVHEPDTAA